MNDLIERLQRLISDRCGNGPSGPNYDPELLDVISEAADALEAALEDAGKLRETLRTVSAVGIVQLFDTARDDVLAEFSLEELQEISRVSEHKRPEQVERIYREGWDAAIDRARGKAWQEVGNG